MITPPLPKEKPFIPVDLHAKWQRTVNLMVKVMQVDVGVITRLDGHDLELYIKSDSDNGLFPIGHRESIGDGSFSAAAIQAGQSLLVPDAEKDVQWRGNKMLQMGFRYYQGYPLKWPDQEVFGTFCILDKNENFNATEKQEIMLDFQFMIESDLKTLYDTAEREFIQRQLLAQEAELSALFHHAYNPIVVMKKQCFFMVNPALVTLFGYTHASELLGRPVIELIGLEERTRIQGYIYQRENGGTAPLVYETVGLRKNGECFDLSIKISKYVLEGVTYVVGIVDDVTENNRILNVLRESEERYKAFVDHVADGIYRLELDEPIALDLPPEEQARLICEKAYFAECNQALCDMYGFDSPLSMMGKRLDDAGEKADPAEHLTGILQTVKAGYRVFELESREINHEGQLKYFSNTTIGIIKDGFLQRFWATQTDISTRKLAEDQMQASVREKSTLLKEIHHRVKNNLQVISSLLSLQARQCNSAEVNDVFGQCRDRIRSMALVHEQLYRSDTFSNIEIGQYLRKLIRALQLNYHGQEQGLKIALHVDEIFLSIEKAIPCGLIANECITNVYKHAYPASFKGPREMCVDLKKVDEHSVRFIVTDRGVGLPYAKTPGENQSLGMRLIRMLTEDQLDGTLCIESGCGTTIDIEFPLIDKGR